jgi:hypothetical protein
VYCPETGATYLVPIKDLPVKVEGALRIEHARNGQQRGVRSGDPYEIARVIVEDGQALTDLCRKESTPAETKGN